MRLEKLKKVCANNKPVLFLGAGASISSNALNALDIVDFILQDYYHIQDVHKAKYTFEQEYECKADFENVMEKIYDSEHDRKKIVQNFLNQLELSEGYRYLAVLLKLGYFYPVILTTNHDTLIEKCISEDKMVQKDIKVISCVQEDLTENFMDLESDTVYVLHLHGSFASTHDIYVTSKSTFSLSNNCKEIVKNLVKRSGLIMVGYGYKDVDFRNFLQTLDTIKKGIFYLNYGRFNKKSQNELIKMLEHHNSSNNIVEDISFDSFFIDLGKDASCAYQREKGEAKIDELYEMLDRTRCFNSERVNNLDMMKMKVEECYQNFKLDELLALREFVYYEVSKNGEIYRLQQGIKFLENAIYCSHVFTSENYMSKIRYYLCNEYLNLFLSGDNILENKVEYLDKIIGIGDGCIKRMKKENPNLTLKFMLLVGEALKEKAMLNENPIAQRNNVKKAREILTSAIKEAQKDEKMKYYLGIAYRHLAVTYELESDLLQDNADREKCIEKWKKNSKLAAECLEKFDENTVRGYAKMNIAASNIAMLQIHIKEEYAKQLISEGLENLQKAIELHMGMDEYRGLAWSNIHKCKLLKMQIKHCGTKDDICNLLIDMEDSANIAVNNILRTDDMLGKGLAYQQLGIALSLYNEYIDDEADIKLESAIAILRKSVEILKNTGFFRGLTDSCIGLSAILYKKWKKTGNIKCFIEAYNNLSIGFTTACENLDFINKVEILYEQLRTETNKIVELI